MKSKKSILRLTAILSLVLLIGAIAFAINANTTNNSEVDYTSLKNGVELKADLYADNQPTADFKCGDEGGDEEKCGEEGDDEKKCGEGDGDGDGDDEKCGEGKCGEGKCGEGKCGGADDSEE